MTLKITNKKVWRLATTEVLSSTEPTDEYRYADIKLRVGSRLVCAFSYQDRKPKRDVAVVTVFEDGCEHRYWVDARIRTVAGLRKLAMQVLRHHELAKAEVGS